MRASILNSWTRKAAKRRNRPFLEASMAAAALVSMADDDVRLSEQVALDEVLERIDKLQVFEPHTAIDLHRHFADQIQADALAGRKQALEAVAHFEGDQNDRLVVLYVAAVIARADLDLSETEEVALAQICECLGLVAEESLTQIWGAVAANHSAD
jgi:tellurite resistance protein